MSAAGSSNLQRCIAGMRGVACHLFGSFEYASLSDNSESPTLSLPEFQRCHQLFAHSNILNAGKEFLAHLSHCM